MELLIQLLVALAVALIFYLIRSKPEVRNNAPEKIYPPDPPKVVRKSLPVMEIEEYLEDLSSKLHYEPEDDQVMEEAPIESTSENKGISETQQVERVVQLLSDEQFRKKILNLSSKIEKYEKEENQSSAARIRNSMKNPHKMRDAFILSEIMKRKD